MVRSIVLLGYKVFVDTFICYEIPIRGMRKMTIQEEVARAKAYGQIHQQLRTMPMDRWERMNYEKLMAFYGGKA